MLVKDVPDMSAIRAFVAVAQAGSFSKGAQSVGLTRSAVGKALARLEERLGTRLLHRTTRAVSLTVEGQILLERFVRILDDLAEAEDAVRHNDAEPAGTLRLTIPDAFGRHQVLPILTAFLKRWPRLSAEVSLTDRIVDVVDEGYDLAIRCGGPLADSRMIARVVARSRTIVCAAPDYLANHGRPRTIDDLASHDRITLGDAHTARPWHLAPPGGSVTQIGTFGRLHLDSGTAVRQAVLDGLGLGYLPEFLVADDLAAGRLVSLLDDHDTDELTLHALYPHRRHLAAKVRLLVDLLGAGSAAKVRTPFVGGCSGTSDIRTPRGDRDDVEAVRN